MCVCKLAMGERFMYQHTIHFCRYESLVSKIVLLL